MLKIRFLPRKALCEFLYDLDEACRVHDYIVTQKFPPTVQIRQSSLDRVCLSDLFFPLRSFACIKFELNLIIGVIGVLTVNLIGDRPEALQG